jgi:hypothetical protein
MPFRGWPTMPTQIRGVTASDCGSYMPAATEYFVHGPPAKRIEFGPSPAKTLPSASTAMPSPAAPW